MTTVIEMLIKSAASGDLKPHQLLSNVRANEALTYKDRWARFTKIKPNSYRVEVGNKGNEKPSLTDFVETPVEAKLAVIEHVVDAARSESITAQ